MDPGTIIGLIVTGTTLASKAYNWTQSLKTASSEVKAIEGDLGVILDILRRIQNDIRRRTPESSLFPEEVQTLLERSLKQCQSLFPELEKLMDRYDRVSTHYGQKLMWTVAGKEEADGLGRSLTAQKMTLNMTLSLANNYTSFSLNQGIQVTTENTQQIIGMMQALQSIVQDLPSTMQTNIQSAINCASTYTGVNPPVKRRPEPTASNVGYDNTDVQSPSQDITSKKRDSSSLTPAVTEGPEPAHHASGEVVTVAAASHTLSLPHRPAPKAAESFKADTAPDLFMLALQKSPSGDTPQMTNFKEAVLRGMRHFGTEDYLMAEAVFKSALEEAVQNNIPVNGLYVLATKDLAQIALLKGNLDKAGEIYKSVVEMCETIGSPDDKIVFECLDKLGYIYKKQDKLSEADAVISRALAGRQRASKAEDIDGIRAMYEVAYVAYHSENWPEAEKWLLRAIAGYDKIGAVNPKQYKEAQAGTLLSLRALGHVYFVCSDFGKAEEVFERALALNNKLGGDSTLADLLYRLGKCYSERGKFEHAEATLSEFLRVWEHLGCPKMDRIGVVWDMLSEAFEEQGNISKAYLSSIEAHAFYMKNKGAKSPDTIRTAERKAELRMIPQFPPPTRKDIARPKTPPVQTSSVDEQLPDAAIRKELESLVVQGISYFKAEDFLKAESTLKAALEPRFADYSHEKDVLLAMTYLARVYKADPDKLNQSTAMYVAAVTGYQSISAYLDWNYLLAAKELGKLYAKDPKKVKEAEQIFRGILDGFAKIGALEKKETLKTMDYLARLLYKRKKVKEAEAIWLRSLENHEKLNALSDMNAVDILGRLAELYRGQKKWKAMEDCTCRALGVLEIVRAMDSPGAMPVYRDMSVALENQGDFAKALETMQVAEDGFRRWYGSEHEETREAVIILARIRKKKEKSEKRGWFRD